MYRACLYTYFGAKFKYCFMDFNSLHIHFIHSCCYYLVCFIGLSSGSNSPISPHQTGPRGPIIKSSHRSSRQTFAACALLNPGLLHRYALSVDETSPQYRYIKNNYPLIIGIF